MTYIVTASGTEFDLLNPKVEDVHLSDIAHALARIPRYTGHARAGLHCSVAEHSVRVCQLSMQVYGPNHPNYHWAALLHDAHEAFVGDVSSPLKRAMRTMKVRMLTGVAMSPEIKSDFDVVETVVLSTVRAALDVDGEWWHGHALIGELDRLDLADESKAALGVSFDCAPGVAERLKCRTFGVAGFGINTAEAEFLSLAVALAPTAELRSEASEALVELVRRVVPST